MSPRHFKLQPDSRKQKTGQKAGASPGPLPFAAAAEVSLFDQIKRLTENTTFCTNNTNNKSTPPAPENLKLGDDYEVLELLGQGGMGYVYKVKDKRKNQVVAVKVVRQELTADPRALKRFEQEAEAAMGLIHPNLVPVYAQGITSDGAPYLVMEYQEGNPLNKVLKREHHLKADRAIDIAMQICDALAHAHGKGIVHRDLKPSNIVLTRGIGNVDLVRLVDFGIAKVLAGPESRQTFELTNTGDLFGSPSYMSPEQCMGYNLDARSDIYSLGCVMYELLTGQPPFISDNPVQTIVKHLSDLPKRLNQYSLEGQTIPESLEALVMRCLEKDPRNRYQSMERLHKDLSIIQTGARPVPYTRSKENNDSKVQPGIILAALALINIFILAAAFSQHEAAIQSMTDARSLITKTKNVSRMFSQAVEDLRAYNESHSTLFLDRYTKGVGELYSDVPSLYRYYPQNMQYRDKVIRLDTKMQQTLSGLNTCKEKIDSRLAGVDLNSNSQAVVELTLRNNIFDLQEDFQDVNADARHTLERDPVSETRNLLILELLTLMIANSCLFLAFNRKSLADGKKKIWSKD